MLLNLENPTFERHTKWNIFTGGPCSGKTSVIKELGKMGYSSMPEVARQHIEERLAQGVTIHVLRKDEGKFQRDLIEAKLQAEVSADPQATIFFDRAMLDTLAYYRLAGLDPMEVLESCLVNKYANVFIFDMLPFERDHARTEDSKTAAFLDYWHEKDYTSLGYQVIRVPVMDVVKRSQFVLERMCK